MNDPIAAALDSTYTPPRQRRHGRQWPTHRAKARRQGRSNAPPWMKRD